MRPPRAALAVAATGLLAVLALAPSAGADTVEAPLGAAERVLVFSVPTLAWDEVGDGEAPNLEGFLSDAAIAALSVRSVSRLTTATDAYATLNAGTRAEGAPLAQLAFVAGTSRTGRLDENGDPLEVPTEAYAEEEPADAPEVLIEAPTPTPEQTAAPADAPGVFVGTPMAEEFARRSGVEPKVGEVFNFGIVAMERLNERLLYGAEVGSLGDALAGAGLDRAVIANGDHGEGSDVVDFRREASVALMDRNGLVQRGMVGRDLLADDPEAPYGTRLDNAAVTASFEDMWTERSVVLVEASDMVRAEDAKALSTDARAAAQRRDAIRWSDELFGALLQRVDLSADAVVVVAPYAVDGGTSLTVLGVRSPQVDGGLLSSGTTRRAGHVQTVDIAPTVLSLLGVDAPSSMEGTPMERHDGGGGTDRFGTLVQVNDAALFRDRTVGIAAAIFVIAQVVLWAGAGWAMSARRPGTGRVVQLAALAVLLWLPATFVAGLLPFERWGAAAYWTFTVALAVGSSAAVWWATWRRDLVDPLALTLGALVALLSIDVLTGGPMHLNTVFGYSPTVAGRFDGMGNPAFAMFTAAAIILAALVAHRVGGRRGAWAGIALLGWAVILDGSPFLGADVGGALTLVPAAAVTAWMLLGLRIRIRTAVLWSVVAVVAVTGLGLLDAARPAAERTHLGRLIADIGDNGFEALQTVVLRKLDANLSVLLRSVWTLMLPLVFASVALVFWRSPGRLRTIRERIPEERAAVAGLLTAMVLGFALNDSGIAVPGMMLGVVSASLIHLMFRVGSTERATPVAAVGTNGDGAQVVGAQVARR